MLISFRICAISILSAHGQVVPTNVRQYVHRGSCAYEHLKLLLADSHTYFLTDQHTYLKGRVATPLFLTDQLPPSGGDRLAMPRQPSYRQVSLVILSCEPSPRTVIVFQSLRTLRAQLTSSILPRPVSRNTNFVTSQV